LLQAPAGVRRAFARLRPATSDRSNLATIADRRPRLVRIAPRTSIPDLRARLRTARSTFRLTAPSYIARSAIMAVRRRATVDRASDRLLPLLVAALVAIASVISFQPAAAQPIGGTDGAGTTPRIAIGGLVDGGAIVDGTVPTFDVEGLQGLVSRAGGPTVVDAGVGSIDQVSQQVSAAYATGPFADDGTLFKAFAPETTVADGKSLLTSYTVQPGDTLTGIASRFGVSMMTLWWANSLTSKDSLHPGQVLIIPPVSGLVVTVKDGDTIESLAVKYGIDPSSIIEVNQLADPTLVIGQTLVMPGAAGAGIPTPKPAPRTTTSRSSSSAVASGVGGKYTGGKLLWPVVGGNNYISQYFHYGHYAVDIAATYGSTVRAAAAGKVIFAGWKNNGGGWQVWISHGGNLYTTYNHMSRLSVATGQSVSRGQKVGAVGQSGHATGPHLHFEVWIGPVWNGGTRVNPLRYF
jgi:murein DD-endopeptidase MepM/ murein hydrolase activator NlpD